MSLSDYSEPDQVDEMRHRIEALQKEQSDLLKRLDGLRAENAHLTTLRKSVRGTQEGELNGIHEFAAKECGYNLNSSYPGPLTCIKSKLECLQRERETWAAAMALGAEGTKLPRGVPDMAMMGRAVNRICADDELHDVMNLIVGMARSIPKIERARIVELEARLREVAEERNTTLVPLRDAADEMLRVLKWVRENRYVPEAQPAIERYEKVRTPKKPFDPSDPTWDGDRNCPADEREGEVKP